MQALGKDTNDQFRAEPVNAGYRLDSGPGRYRIGLLALSNDLATERDFINMRPTDEVALFVSRIPNDETCSVEKLSEMEPELTRAAALLIPGSRLDSIAYSCTSGTVVLGYDTVVQRVHEARPQIPVSSPITAALAALQRFDARRIAVLTPYTDDVNAQVFDYVTARGVEISAFSSFHISSNEEMAKLAPQSIYEAAIQADRPDADALFISCTAIRAVDVLDSIEQAIGKPVISANQTLFWQALRQAGYTEPQHGFGSLLELTEH